jgi:endonuclease YncB( thermonuclease family)
MVRLLLLILTSALSACGGGDGASFAPPTAATHCGVNVGDKRLTGTVMLVEDGDTIFVAGERVRLASIDAPEWRQAYDQQSRADLAVMVLNQTVTVTYSEKDRFDRVVGTVFKTDCTNVNRKMVEEGAAWYYEAYKCEIDIRQRTAYATAQAEAKATSRGLWSRSDNPVAPWVYPNGVEAKVPASCPKGDAASI